MVVDIDKTKQSGEFARAINQLEAMVKALTDRITVLETGLNDNTHYVVNSAGTTRYLLTIVNGKITAIT